MSNWQVPVPRRLQFWILAKRKDGHWGLPTHEGPRAIRATGLMSEFLFDPVSNPNRIDMDRWMSVLIYINLDLFGIVIMMKICIRVGIPMVWALYKIKFYLVLQVYTWMKAAQYGFYSNTNYGLKLDGGLMSWSLFWAGSRKVASTLWEPMGMR